MRVFWILFFLSISATHFAFPIQNIISDKDLITALLAAETKEKQEQLIEAHKDLINQDIPKAQSSTEDGLLEAHEIMNLNLNADLAVLSACETARGKVAAGEGVIGLSWAFFVAGVPTTVVSQWKVDSASTTDLMLEFHRNLTQKKLPPAKALQQAELKLLRTGQFSHPFYWSAFVVIGNGFSAN